jgi:cell wall-associated NlpC family hydrolase
MERYCKPYPANALHIHNQVDKMGNFALVGAPIAALTAQPFWPSERADEALHGMKVEILQECPGGWARVRTHYRYEGCARIEDLTVDDATVERWESLPKKTVMKAQADVLSAPKIQGWIVESLPRGAVLAELAGPDENGWVRVGLADGREGYVREGFLGEYWTSRPALDDNALRNRLAETALAYLGTQYRWGGKTPQGIDCSGLCSMVYLLNGIVIYRDADILEEFCMRKIPVEQAKKGDLIFFKGHVAMHLGGGRIVHATAKNSSDGVVPNSLNPGDRDYRPDLLSILRFAGTVF